MVHVSRGRSSFFWRIVVPVGLALGLLAGCAPAGEAVLPSLVPTMALLAPSTETAGTPAPILPLPGRDLAASVTPISTLPDSPLPSPTPYPSPTPLPVAPVTGAAPAAPTAVVPTGTISGWQSWGLIPSDEGLWAVRADGGQVVLLTADPIIDLAVAPSGSVAAYLTHPDPNNHPENNPFGYSVKLIFPATGEVRAIAPLDSQAAGMDPNAALRVISAYAFGGMAWSPGSGYLAYVSGKEGGSGEVYLYNVRSGQTTRLPAPTGDSPSYAFGLRFSPGGQKIYFNRAYEFGTSTYALAGAWVGGLDGSLVQVAGSQSSAEQLVAWMNEDQIMVSSVQPDCGEQNLRLVSLRGQPDQVVWPGCFADRIYERGLGSMILSVTPDIAAIQPSTPAGVYRVRIRDGSVQRITERSFTRLSSSGRAYTWYGYQPQEGLSLVSLNGQVTPVFQGPPYDGSDPELNRPLRAVSGQNAWFWDGNGLFLVDPSQPDQQPRVIFPLPVTNLTQSPSDRRLYFFLAYDGSAGRLYAIRAGEWQPYLVDEHIQTARSITWTH